MLTPSPLERAEAKKLPRALDRTRLVAMPPNVSETELLSATARPPNIPRERAALSLLAKPNRLSATDEERLTARPPNRPLALARLLLRATPPIVAATLSLRANARPPNRPPALACELLTATPRSAMASDVLMARPRPWPLAVEFATARPPFVAAESAMAVPFPMADALDEAEPPLVEMDVAIASAASETVDCARMMVAVSVRSRFMVLPPFRKAFQFVKALPPSGAVESIDTDAVAEVRFGP